MAHCNAVSNFDHIPQPDRLVHPELDADPHSHVLRDWIRFRIVFRGSDADPLAVASRVAVTGLVAVSHAGRHAVVVAVSAGLAVLHPDCGARSRAAGLAGAAGRSGGGQLERERHRVGLRVAVRLGDPVAFSE